MITMKFQPSNVEFFKEGEPPPNTNTMPKPKPTKVHYNGPVINFRKRCVVQKAGEDFERVLYGISAQEYLDSFAQNGDRISTIKPIENGGGRTRLAPGVYYV